MKLSILRSLLVPATLALIGAAVVGGCVITSTKPAPPPTVTPPPSQPSMLGADGHHFAIARHYQGQCMGAGTRGGCYALDFQPDGSYRQMLLDAAVSGTYAIDTLTVTLTPGNNMEPSTMTLSADGIQLGDYVYQPVDPTPVQQVQ